MVSTMGVIDSTLKMSCCAGIANQIKFGIIIKKKSANPKISKPNLYFFKTCLPPQTTIFLIPKTGSYYTQIVISI